LANKEKKEAMDPEDIKNSAEKRPSEKTNSEEFKETSSEDKCDKENDLDPSKKEDSEKEESSSEKRSEKNKKTDKDSKAEKKEEKKEEKKDPRDETIADLTDKLQRQLAEFDNFRKRTEKEKSSMYDDGIRDTLLKILPIIDNFERALSAESEDTPFKEGMDKIYKMFIKNLEEIGATPMDAKGKTFDPNLHNAVLHIDDENYGESEVVEELQKGYMFRGKVLRHSMVKVAN
jgi:molecular chaperone GrpE